MQKPGQIVRVFLFITDLFFVYLSTNFRQLSEF